MTQPQIELLPCPNPNCISVYPEMEDNFVLCIECSMCGPVGQTSEDAADKWNALLRSSPHVAPGQLREQIYHAIIGEDARKDWRLYLSQIDSIARIAADIAAAQGGQVDALKLLQWIAGEIKSLSELADQAREENNGSDGDIRKISNLDGRWQGLSGLLGLINRGDFSAVPSAPGCERVQKAWDEFECLTEEEHRIFLTRPAFIELRDSIAALGQPQGSDSLCLTKTEAITVLNEQSYMCASTWRSYEWGAVATVDPVRFPDQEDYRLCEYVVIAVAEKLIRDKPAQPVAAGEAQGDGDGSTVK